MLAVTTLISIMVYRRNSSTKSSLATANRPEVLTEMDMDVNQAYATTTRTDSMNQDTQQAVGVTTNIKMDINQAYVSTTVPTESNVAYGTLSGPIIHDYDYVAQSIA